jgi:hypothetical protein
VLLAAVPNPSTKASTLSPNSLLNYWSESFFGLDRVTLFQTATPTEKAEILHQSNVGLLEEAYFVEHIGIGYMAKMVLLAETAEERTLYGLFAADEATHLSQISPLLPAIPNGSHEPFLQFLADLVEYEDKAVLLLVIQVVLEGWGLSHYRSLANGCNTPTLANLFTSFLQAESRHHATGSLLLHQRQLSATSRALAIDTLATFLQMIRVGPHRLLSTIDRVKGGLSQAQKIRILDELGTEAHSLTRLTLVRSLLHQHSPEIVQQLEQQQLFQPLSAVASVATLCS